MATPLTTSVSLDSDLSLGNSSVGYNDPQLDFCLKKYMHRFLEDGKVTEDDDDYFYKHTDEVEYDYGIIDDYFYGNEDPDEPMYYKRRNAFLAMMCVGVAAVMAGLLMGVMSLDPLILEIKARTAKTAQERKEAATLVSFVKRKNLMLVSILIVNMGVNEALPLFLDRLVPTYVSVLLSTTLVVLVGEILPSAYLTGPNQIPLAYKLLPVLRVTIFFTFPISYPLSKCIDHHFESEAEETIDGQTAASRNAFRRSEVSAYIKIKHEQRKGKAATEDTGRYCQSIPEMLLPEDGLCGVMDPVFGQCGTSSDGLMRGPSSRRVNFDVVDDDDIANIERVLEFREKLVADTFTPLNKVYAISSQTALNEETVVDIYNHGHSRVPVYDKSVGSSVDTSSSGACLGNIRGILLAKQLMVIDKSIGRAASTMPLFRPPCIGLDTPMMELMAIFRAAQRKDSQMAIVCNFPQIANAALRNGEAIPMEAQVAGIITFQDVLSAVAGQIHDEKDRKIKAAMQIAKWAFGKWKAFVLVRRLEREKASAGCKCGDQPFSYRVMTDDESTPKHGSKAASSLPDFV